MKRKFELILLVLTLPLCMVAKSPSAYNYLDIPSSTHTYGLGGVNVTSVSEDINIIDQNPALLGPEFETQMGVNYMHYIGGSNFAGLKFGTAAGEHGAWAAGIQYYGYGSMKMTGVEGNAEGEFSPKDVNFSATYSHDITDRWRGGASVKFLYSSYAEYTALALATDLGINYYDPESDLSISAVVANLGGQVKRFDRSYDRLPLDVRLGWSKTFGTFPVRFSVTAWRLTDWKSRYYKMNDAPQSPSDAGVYKYSFGANLFRHLVFGAEFNPSANFHLGLGYNYRVRSDMSSYSRSFLSGLSVGAGIKVKSFGVGVALAQPHTGATTIMFNLSTNISELL